MINIIIYNCIIFHHANVLELGILQTSRNVAFHYNRLNISYINSSHMKIYTKADIISGK